MLHFFKILYTFFPEFIGSTTYPSSQELEFQFQIFLVFTIYRIHYFDVLFSHEVFRIWRKRLRSHCENDKMKIFFKFWLKHVSLLSWEFLQKIQSWTLNLILILIIFPFVPEEKYSNNFDCYVSPKSCLKKLIVNDHLKKSVSVDDLMI